MVKLAELLRGCTPGRVQAVGLMQVVPLLSDIEDERFVAPDRAAIGTAAYGNLVVKNLAPDRTLLVPPGACYVVKERAQDHALPHAAVLKGGQTKQFTTACCVQEGQGGLIGTGTYQMMLLPFPLREQAHRLRAGGGIGRLWGAIKEFNHIARVATVGYAGQIAHFFGHYADQLDAFVAEFEPVPGQVGCVVLVNGRVVGIERCPSHAYFRSIWRPLIRDCYGSLAAVEATRGAKPIPPKTRVPLRTAVSLDDLEAALGEAEAEERARVSALLSGLLQAELPTTADDGGEAGLVVESVGPKPFVGQVIRDGDRVVYASLTAAAEWKQHEAWLLAKPFQMA